MTTMSRVMNIIEVPLSMTSLRSGSRPALHGHVEAAGDVVQGR